MNLRWVSMIATVPPAVTPMWGSRGLPPVVLALIALIALIAPLALLAPLAPLASLALLAIRGSRIREPRFSLMMLGINYELIPIDPSQ